MKETSSKIIFIHEGAITPTIVRMYLIDELVSQGFDVELWSLRFLRTLWNNLADEISRDIYRKVDTYADLKILLSGKDTSKTIIITSVADNYLNRHIYLHLHKKHFLYLFVDPYGSFMGKNTFTIKDRIKLAFSSNILKKIVPELKKIYHNKVFKPLHHIDFDKHVLASVKPREIAINSNDYEAYLSLENDQERLVAGRYILFIDIFFPLHPDMPYFYGIQDVDSKPYLTSLNQFFSMIEKKYQMPVVIALHPKSLYTDVDFEGRRTYKYKTHSLIKDADIVLSHGSTSTTLAVVYNKPTLFFFFQNMIDVAPKVIQKLIWTADSFGKEARNIDIVGVDAVDITTFDDKYRDFFIYNFMTTKENEHKSNKDIIIPLLDDLFNKLRNGEKTSFQA